MRFIRKTSTPPVRGESIIKVLLKNRGISDDEAAKTFFSPSEQGILDPFGLPDMEAAVERITAAVSNDELICIYGDYDVDGMCATAMLVMFFESIGARVMYKISHRDDGYGINPTAVTRLAQAGVSLIITVDNGISAIDAIEKCAELGVSAIVTDHHICGSALPACDAVICPKRPDSLYQNRDLCGAGVAFKLIHALSDMESAFEYISLAGMATISDIVPLKGENRVIAYLALRAINEGYCPVGVTALCAQSGARREQIRERDIAFGVAPRMNASGRIDDASIGVKVLCCDNRAECDRLAARLTELNKSRQDIEASIRDDVLSKVDTVDLTDKRIIVLESESWHPGVLGIVASKIAEKYYRPTVLLTRTDNILTGSSRSVPGVDIHEVLGQAAELFTRFGGHSQAAGLTLPVENLEAFIDAAEAYLQTRYDFEYFVPSQSYEEEVNFDALNMALVKQLDAFAPFGEGNPEPVFCARGVKLYSIARTGAEGNHLRADVIQGGRTFPAVFFGAGDRFEALSYADTVDILYTPMENNWKDQSVLQLKLVAVNPVAVRMPESYIKERRDKFVGAFFSNITYNAICEDIAVSQIDGAEAFMAALSRRDAGVCGLCFTESGAIKALELVKELNVDIAFGKPTCGPCAYNTLLLAPELQGLDLSGFRRIVVLDDCGSDGVVKALAAIAKNAELSVDGGSDDAWYEDMAQRLVLDREQYRIHYSAIYGMGNGNVLTASALTAMARRTDCDMNQCRFVLNVFSELGFVGKVSDTVLRLNRQAPFRELTGSRRYSAAAAFGEIRKNMNKKRAESTGRNT